MPIVLKPNELFVKNPTGSGYLPQNVIAEQTTADMVDTINAAGAAAVSDIEETGEEVRESIPDDYHTLSETVNNVKENLVLVQGTEPDEPDNKIWIKPTSGDIGVPTLDEFNSVKSAIGEIEEKQDEYFGEDAISIQLSDLAGYDKHDGTIGSQGTWTNVTDTLATFKHIAIPIPRTGCRLQITNGAGIDLVIAGLKTYTPPTANGETIDFSATFGRTVRGQGGSVSVDLPDDVKYVAINMIVGNTDVTISAFSITKAKVDGKFDLLEDEITKHTADIALINEQDYSTIANLQIAKTIESRQIYRSYAGAVIEKGNWYKIAISKISGRIAGESITVKTTSAQNSESVVESVSVYNIPSAFTSTDIYFQCQTDGAKYFYFAIVTDPGNLGLNITISQLTADLCAEDANEIVKNVQTINRLDGAYFGVDASDISLGNLSGYIQYNGAINSSGKWVNIDSESFKHIIIPVSYAGALLQFTASADNETDTIVCGLKSYSVGHQNNDDADLATTPSRTTISSGASSRSRSFYLSDDCSYLLIPTLNSGKAVNFSAFSLSWTAEQRRGGVNRLNDYAGRGPVMAFIDDDGFAESVTNWEAVADASGICVTFALITSQVGQTNYSVTWDTVSRMMGKGHEFVSHTDGHINLNESTDEQILADCAATTLALRTHGCTGPMYLVYPYGNSPQHISDTIQKYFVAGVKTGDDRYNTPPIKPYEIYRSSICSDMSGTKEERTIDGQTYELFVYKTLAQMKTIIDNAIEHQAFLVWMTHLRKQASTGYWYDDDIRDTLIGAIEYAAEKGVKVLTFGKGYEICKNRIATENEIVDCDGVVHELN